MKGNKVINYLLIFCVFIISGCSSQQNEKNIVTIAIAANMQFAMEALTKEFTKQSGVECALIVGSSGKLTAQIKEGAPYDVFVAANMKYPQEIYNSGLAESLPKVYAYGKLVLWSMMDDVSPSIELLKTDKIQHIALANPKTAPYGNAATEVLDHYQIFNEIERKLVFGESIAQTNQYITSQSADIGFTAMSVVLSPKMKEKGNWVEVDPATYTPIEQGVVVIKHDNEIKSAATEFNNFLFSEDAKKILINFGYSVDE